MMATTSPDVRFAPLASRFGGGTIGANEDPGRQFDTDGRGEFAVEEQLEFQGFFCSIFDRSQIWAMRRSVVE